VTDEKTSDCIEIRAGWAERDYVSDLWRFRELFFFLAWRDIQARYKQTAIGVAWSLIKPIVTMIVFSVIFGRLARLPAGELPYPVLVFAALLPWQFFANALAATSESLLGNAQLITKVYFPRLIIPVSSVIVGLVDFLLSFLVFLCLLAWYAYLPPLRVCFMPLFLLLGFVNALGFGVWFAALNVRYRDFRHLIPFVIQIGLYISPVGFSSAVIPEEWRLLYCLNPMTGVIDGFRWCLQPQATLYWPGLCLATVAGLLVLVSGMTNFRRLERSFADEI